MLTDLVWGAPSWVWPAAGMVAIIAATVVWNYGWRGMKPGVAGLALALKLLAVGLLAICLLDPLRSGTRPKPQANLFSILVDDSQSMTMKSVAGGQSRGERIAEQLDTAQPWRVRLAQDFDVRSYQFASRLEPLSEPPVLASDGTSSMLSSSLKTLSERLQGRPVGGVLLLSDGNLTDDSGPQSDWSKLGFPVFPVVLTGESAPGDIRIDNISVTQSDFETAPVSIKVVVASQALPSQEIIVRLIDAETAKTVEEQTIRVPADGQSQPLAIKFRPAKPGIGFYRVVAFRKSDGKSIDSGGDGTESTFANNSRWLSIDRGQGPHRILYVSGRPNWEFKFIRRALQTDPEVKLVGLLRIANKESKFTFRDREVSSTNPLFAGLGGDEEEASQQYDEPVMLRLGVEVADELSSGFPRTAEELFGYEAVILDDIEPEFFSQDQLLMLRRFVTFRGGGLMMLGGQESFDVNRFANSPLGELSPVYAPRRDVDSVSDVYRWDLTREGMLQPWLRLRDTEDAESKRLRAMPNFNTLSPVGSPKPGAIAMASVRDSQGRVLPGLVVQRFGKGKSAALTLGDNWKWSMRREEGKEDEPARLWRQMLRWLVSDIPRRVDCQVQFDGGDGGRATIVTDVRDASYLPLDNAKVEINVTGPDGKSIDLVAQNDGGTAGRYQTRYFTRQSGGYLAAVRVTAEDGSEIATTNAGWTAQPSEAEFRQWDVNREFLERLAEQSGGEVIEDRNLESFVADLSNRKVPVTQVWTYPLWHQPWVMMVAMLCLCGEWGLRRWKGMP